MVGNLDLVLADLLKARKMGCQIWQLCEVCVLILDDGQLALQVIWLQALHKRGQLLRLREASGSYILTIDLSEQNAID